MAKRYGSTYSPSGALDRPETETAPPRPFDGKRPSKVGARSNLLFFAAIPLAWKAFQAPPTVMAGYLAALGALMAAAFMTREGLKAEEAYDARKVARRPALPRKILGSILTALGLGLVGWFGWGPAEAALFAILGGILHPMAFGIDPLKSKGFDGADTFQQDRVARAVEEAEKHLDAMRGAVARAADRTLEARLERFTTTARAMFRTVEEDPRDLTAARKYLGVYLLGARDATVKFIDIYARSRDAEARAKWVALLDDLEQNFAARNETLLIEDKTGLDIEIDVLRERLAREGIKR